MLKAGKYYVGDPCYLFDKSWDEVLNKSEFFDTGCFEIFGHKMFAAYTAHGDGAYFDGEGNEYSVDAGVLGILPVELIDIDKKYTIEEIESSIDMHIVNMPEDFDCESENGIIRFGHIVIDTDPHEEENDEEDFFDDDDDDDDGDDSDLDSDWGDGDTDDDIPEHGTPV